MRRSLPLILLGLFLSHTAWGAGAILVDNDVTGLPVAFEDGLVTYNPETSEGDEANGRLGRLSNAEALALLADLFEDWTSIRINDTATVSLQVLQGNGLGNVDASNLNDIFTYYPPESSSLITGNSGSGINPIIFDEDGSITDLINGEGASNDLLGFAGPRVVERRGDGILYIYEAQAVLNGKFIDCPEDASATDPCQATETDLEDFTGAIFHELGHFLGLDHVQVNLSSLRKAAQGDNSEVEAIPTMIPYYVDGAAMLTPHLDDKVSVSTLYPAASFASNFCTLQGTVYESDGLTELQGVNIVVRNSANQLEEAISAVSGASYVGSFSNCQAAQGTYSIAGLTPGVSYTLETEPITASFTGGSSVEPCDPPASGFSSQTLSGVFTCTQGGEVIRSGSIDTTDIVTNKAVTTTDADASGGGCSLITD